MNKKKTYITIAVAALVLTIGVTFAYFIAQTGAGAKANANITADTVDDLKFSVSKEGLSLSANQFNFAQGQGNLYDSVTATALLKANSTKKTATYNYYVYFQIESNNYIYTTTDKKPEIVLTITGPNGEITSLDSLSYVSAYDASGAVIKGFDITELKSSVIKVADSYEISSSSSTNYTNQDWTFKVTFVNLDSDQTNNEGNNLIGKVLLQQDIIPITIADIAKEGDSLASSVESLGIKGNSSITKLYHHDGSIKDTDGNIIDAGDNSYRFVGSNPNNYVCFGSDAETCPYENLYRIIGLIDGKIKLISADGATTDMLGTDGGYKEMLSEKIKSYYKGSGDLSKVGIYKYFTSETGTWSDSTTNLINLNTNYITYLDGKNSKWQTMIDDTVWYIGELSQDKGINTNAKTAYNYEVGPNKDTSITLTRKIGLMYVSDYYYSASPEYWTLPGYDQDGSFDNNMWSGNDYSKAVNDN